MYQNPKNDSKNYNIQNISYNCPNVFNYKKNNRQDNLHDNIRNHHVFCHFISFIGKYSYEELWQPKNIPVTFRMYQINFDGSDDRVYKKYWDNSSVRFIEKL